jgi:hypothetical protein
VPGRVYSCLAVIGGQCQTCTRSCTSRTAAACRRRPCAAVGTVQ